MDTYTEFRVVYPFIAAAVETAKISEAELRAFLRGAMQALHCVQQPGLALDNRDSIIADFSQNWFRRIKK